MIYLDHLTTTPTLPEVVDAMQPWLRGQFGAPASLHKLGLEARDAIDAARERLAKLVKGAEPEEIIFTSSGTEAINHAVKGAALANRRFGSHIVTTGIEHPAVLGSIAWLESQGFSSTRVGVDGQGRVDPDTLGRAMTDETILVCLQHANLDLGTVQPVAEVAELTSDSIRYVFEKRTTEKHIVHFNIYVFLYYFVASWTQNRRQGRETQIRFGW